ncbi:hypothetical protein HELRODRAFT_163499 [Helobdella robusta]|uniref:Uncharacterized protein n=1 Tax=Helobdella robusta TaxID=6412 RepID=T1EU49_HELRO|nr:hypothetical protein HELRODRAFT_163499 [Helobdella robusta]ESN96438.1 hypothetical protein HELRODRAFT_163499 [Helobdella robusta]
MNREHKEFHEIRRVKIPRFGGLCFLRVLAYLLITVAMASIVLDVVDIAVTSRYCYSTVPRPLICLNNIADDVWTWIASGIWASIPLAVAGSWSAYLLERPGLNPYACVIFLGICAFLFCPVKAALNIVEAVKYKDNTNWSDISYQKIVIPIILAVIAALEFLHCLAIFIDFVCFSWNRADTVEYIEERHVEPPKVFPIATNFHPSPYHVPMNVPYYGVPTTQTPKYVISSSAPVPAMPITNGQYKWQFNQMPSNSPYRIF